MKKTLFLFVFYFIFLEAFSFEGKVINKEEFKVKSVKIDLPNNGGEWKLIKYRGKKVYNAFFNTYILAEFKDGVLSQFVEAFEGHGDADHPNLSNEFFYNYLYNANRIRGCKDRVEYYIFELYKAGTSNCFIIRNWDPYKEIFDPTLVTTDYTDMNYIAPLYQKYVSENNLELPKMMLRSESYYYDKHDIGRIYIINRMINPEINGAPPTSYDTETSSEYFVKNLEKYYLHKKFLDNWSKLQAIRHTKFEKYLNVKSHSKLDLSKYIGDGIVEDMKNLNIIKKEDSNKVKNKDLESLEELYKSGILTKREFEKAKKLILD